MTRPARIRLAPIWKREALAFVRAHHRHAARRLPVAWICGTSVVNESGVVVGVAIVGKPQGRYSSQDQREIAEVTRCCTTGERNACSMLYGAACRLARDLGKKRVITYTRADEDGASLRASGFRPVARVAARDFDTPSRRRVPREPGELIERIRWEREVAA